MASFGLNFEDEGATVISHDISEKIGTLVTLVDLAIVAFVLLASPKVSVGDVCTGTDFGGFY